MNQPNQVQERAPQPPGLLPKNVQSWLLIGLALLMVLIMWLTGGKKPPVTAKAIPPAPLVQAPLEVNDARYDSLKIRILYESDSYPLIRRSPSASTATSRQA